jgi:hypothetical protein
MRPPPTFEVTDDQQEMLERGKLHEDFILNPLWREIEEYLTVVVEEALDQMRGNQSHEPMIAYRMKLVWQEREAFRDKLILYVKGPIRAKLELLKQIEEERETYGRSAY